MRTKNPLKVLSILSAAAIALTGCEQIDHIVTDVAAEQAGEAVSEWLTPSEEETPESASLANTGEAGTALEQLPVKGKAPKTGYDRKQFGQAWKDTDHNGCDQRNDTLKRYLTNLEFKENTRNCVVLSGTFQDPYTGETIEHVRGQSRIDIDHIVALGQAWVSGAQQLTLEERTELANDPLNLIASGASANRQKGDKEASAWLPPNKAFRCEYVSRQIMVKDKYHLSVTKSEKITMITILNGCEN